MRLPRSSELTPCAADTEVADKTRAGPWRVYARTVVGPIHLADRLPNQDAVDWRPRRRRSSADCLSAAVADGHGHRLHLRSAVGARLATSSLVAELERISQRAASGLEHPLLERLVQVDLIQGLTSSWRQEVAADLRAHQARSDLQEP